ncbi:MAG: substrate-binding domain-containing protein [Pirellulales bacterium]
MRVIPVLALLATLIGCSSDEEAAKTITLATTTSVRDTGLLDLLVPGFERQTGIVVLVVAVGSGQALDMGRRGDADVLLTHAPDAEEKFMAEGHGSQRRLVMHNDFVLIGPKLDPAGLSGEESITAALAQLSKSKAPFVSRGDESGTHLKEKEIWEKAGIIPNGGWYIRAGSGMVQTQRMASEKRAYTLSDRGTYLAQRSSLDLAILSQGDPLLRNQYAVIVVNPAKHPHVKAAAARRFADFMLSPETQSSIGRFGADQFGEPLFFPDAAQGSHSAGEGGEAAALRRYIHSWTAQ